MRVAGIKVMFLVWVEIEEGRGLRDVGQEIKCGFCCARGKSELYGDLLVRQN